ncbi:hypothetical protein EDF57_103178 [Novosphingobium sp. PhB55]|uniref:hypothetical protein n=1 Tax=Novosphingobium sp. PhB55 TaxID=2485106 RepID=UPI0010F33319|nr:hypothetical protein [Novosphingobium sp. PhB55]TDW65004.1 hypothetical protein EDF57_103178 [Novosphingobium sp. PhB55]
MSRPPARVLAAVAGGLALFALAAGPADARRRPEYAPGNGTANPSALVAAEIAFARTAREKGQWKAFDEFADDEAVMFVPEPVRAKEWLSGRKEPAAPVQWQAHQVWMSCDGTMGVTKGAWQQHDGTVGYFTTIWQQRKKGDYRWVLDQGDALAQPLKEPEMLSASVADCAGGPGDELLVERDREKAAPGMDGRGRSKDGTLTWRYHVEADHSRWLAVSMKKNGAMTEVLRSEVAAPKDRN